MCRVASLCAIIEIRSLRGAVLTRSFQSLVKYAAHSSISARRCSADSTIMLFGSAVDTSDHRVSLARSSQGKSNSVASIWVVSSIDTRSTKLKVSLRGSASSTLAERWRIRTANSSRCVGVNIGDTVLRWALCRGWSIAMKLGWS